MNIAGRVSKIEKEIAGVAAQYGVDQYDLRFLRDIKDRTWLTKPQEATLIRIEKKVFGDDDEPEAA